MRAFGVRSLINKSGHAYRSLDPGKATWGDDDWVDAFSSDPMLIKRPIVELDGTPILVGFRESEWTPSLLDSRASLDALSQELAVYIMAAELYNKRPLPRHRDGLRALIFDVILEYGSEAKIVDVLVSPYRSDTEQLRWQGCVMKAIQIYELSLQTK